MKKPHQQHGRPPQQAAAPKNPAPPPSPPQAPEPTAEETAEREAAERSAAEAERIAAEKNAEAAKEPHVPEVSDRPASATALSAPQPIAEEKLKDHVLMDFPEALTLMSDDKKTVTKFKKGINKVPNDLVDHWYVTAVGATRV